jgi:hypothetical protein
MTIALVYDPRYHTFQSWASLMCEAYAGQQLQIPSDNEDEWKSWAVGLNAIDIFTNKKTAELLQRIFLDFLALCSILSKITH